MSVLGLHYIIRNRGVCLICNKYIGKCGVQVLIMEAKKYSEFAQAVDGVAKILPARVMLPEMYQPDSRECNPLCGHFLLASQKKENNLQLR